MLRKLIVVLSLIGPAISFASDISDFDLGTYSLTGKDGQPSGMQMKLSKINGKWVMEGKEHESTANWKSISCDLGCEYRASTGTEHISYLSSFPGDMHTGACQ